MSYISWIVLGVIAGFIGSKIVNKSGQGFLRDIALGVVGAVVGGTLASGLGMGGVTGLNLWSILVSIVGAVIVIWIFHQVTGRSRL